VVGIYMKIIFSILLSYFSSYSQVVSISPDFDLSLLHKNKIKHELYAQIYAIWICFEYLKKLFV